MNSLIALINSRKTWACIISTLILTVTMITALLTLPDPLHKLTAIQTYLYSVAGIWGLNVLGIAHEDASKGKAPEAQVNVGSDVVNTAAPSTEAIAAALKEPEKP